ncbi:DUF2589 domain-containing protein [Streptomyces sp. NPDC017546]|uniref:DUF2589 domain-containing protein n=1 Tax=unclassified Streptomyces TaxID=2593676 RepID=UPI00235DDC23|nr:DUF2589 domain-containing protein [Streptomyces sp. MMBL 11-1]
MAETKKTASAKRTAPTKKTAPAKRAAQEAREGTTTSKATAGKPAPVGPGSADSGLSLPDVPLMPGEDAPPPPVDLGAELSLPFEQIIGGPLQGVIRASAMAASETAEFINKVGFDATGGVKTVAFSYNSTEPTNVNGTTGKKEVKTDVAVPLLSVVPIPYLQLSKVTLDFNVKIDSVSTKKQDSKLGGEASASGGFWGISASVKASYDSSSSSSESVTRSASMSVHVEAEQGPMPAGMEKILTMLTDNAVTVNQAST